MDLNWFDYTIIGIIGLSTIISLARGFIREAFSLAVWLIAFIVAFKFANLVAPYFQNHIDSETIRYAVAFALLMLVSLIGGAIITHFLSMLVSKTGLSGTDRLLGILFGAVRGVFLVTCLIFIGQLSHLKEQPWWKESVLIPQFQPLIDQLERLLPDQIKQMPTYLESKQPMKKEKIKTDIEESKPSSDKKVSYDVEVLEVVSPKTSMLTEADLSDQVNEEGKIIKIIE